MPGPGMQQIQGMGLQQVLAPQLQQSLQILQAPTLELRNIVQQELQTNPVLEEEANGQETEDHSSSDEADFQEEFDRLAKLDEEWRDYMAQNVSYSGRSQEDEERRQFFLDSLANQETLQQHLLEQLNTADVDAQKRKSAELLIGNIDDLGFLSAPLEEIANLSGIADGRFAGRARSSADVSSRRRRGSRSKRLPAHPTAATRQRPEH